jgi:hypothetical protein
MGKVCIVGCETLRIDATVRSIAVKGVGDVKVSVRATGSRSSSGEVIEGKVATKRRRFCKVLLARSLAAEKERSSATTHDDGLGRRCAEAAREPTPTSRTRRRTP